MKPVKTMCMLTSLLSAPLLALAGVAETSATAGSNGRRSGTATATATYDGDGIGLTRTKATSGKLNIARGLSVGLDADGLSISHSYALAGRFGPAVGGTLNLHISPNGETAVSAGNATASGDRERSVTVGGAIGNDRGRGVATAHAGGATGRGGRVETKTFARSSDAPRRYAALGARALVAGRR